MENTDIDIMDNDKIFFHMHKIKLCPENYTVQTFFFKTLRIVRIISGDLVWMINNKKYIVETDDIVVFNNIEIRRIVSVNSKYGAEMEVYEFLPTAVGNSYSCLEVFFKRGENFSNIFKNKSQGHDSAKKIINVIREELLSDQYNKVEMIRGQLISLLVILSRFMLADRNTENRMFPFSMSNAETVADITAYIHNNIGGNLTIGQLAKKANMSPSHFSKLFKLYNNISPYEYIKYMRINHTIQLLYRSDCKIVDAAFESGFKSLSAFYKAFTETLGTSPKSYIKLMT